MNDATDCKECAHPAAHHDAGECWTNPDGSQSWEKTCGCWWYEPKTVSEAAE